MSGLGVGDPSASSLRLQLLVDYLSGLLGGHAEASLVGRITRVVVAGGLLRSSAALSQPTAYSGARQQAAALGPVRCGALRRWGVVWCGGAVPLPSKQRGGAEGLAGCARRLALRAPPTQPPTPPSTPPPRDVDLALTELAGSLPVDVMPGAGDPANYSLPQQPLHPCLFPGAAAYSTLARSPNPHEFEADGVVFLGTSGQNVDDVHRRARARAGEACGGAGGCWARVCAGRVSGSCACLHAQPTRARTPPHPPLASLASVWHRYSDLDDRSEILERMLEWRHLAPTAPDTLAAYPYYDSDPFILHRTPHVFFAGQQPAFATRLATGPDGATARVVAVPSFAATGCLVLVNLATLAAHPVYFEEQGGGGGGAGGGGSA